MSTNIQRFHAATDSLTDDQEMSAANFLLGWIAPLISDDEWDDAVERAVADATRGAAS